MMPSNPRLQQQDLFTRCPELRLRASHEHACAFVPSAFPSPTQFTADGVDETVIGLYVVPEDGNARGAVRQIVAVSGRTATVDAPWSSTVNVTTMRAWLPADVPVVATAAGTASSIRAAGHATDSPGCWNGSLLLFVGGPNAGRAVRVTGCDQELIDFAPALPSPTVPGELAYLRRVLSPSAPPTVSVEQQVVDRPMVGSIDAAPSVLASVKATASFEMPQQGLQSASGGNGAVLAQPPADVGDCLRDVLLERLDQGSTVASAPTQPDRVAVTGGSFSVGGFVLAANGQAAQVVEKAENVLTLGAGQCNATSGVLPGASIYASAWYSRKESGYRTATIDAWRGGEFRQVLHGCLPALTATIERDQFIKLTFAYTAAEAIEYNVRRPVEVGAAYPIPQATGGLPCDGKGARFLVDGTPLLIAKLDIDFGFAPQLRPSLGGLCQADGTYINASPMTINMTALADNDDRAGFKSIVDRMRGGDALSLFYQKGQAPRETFCWAAPTCMLIKGTFSYDNGLGIFTCTLRVVKPQAMRAGANPALPAFAMGWL